MSNRYALLALVLVAVFAAGCVQTQATRLSSKTYPPISPDQVTIYLSEADIPGVFERVALINTQGESTWTNESQMYNAARKKAAELGANGVLIGQIDEPSAGAKVAAAIFSTTTTRRGQMVAIYVLPANDD
jgi:hypothetical protein